MLCNRCAYDLPEDANFCLKCGADQHAPAEQGQRIRQGLRRSVTNRKIAGVCGGLAEHFNVDATLVRLLWIVVAFVPGVVIGAAIAYPVAWLLIPGEKAHGFPASSRELTTSATNRKMAGVCGGFGEYFGVDPTVVRLLWAVLSIWPGFVVGGVIVYLAAWLVMPAPPRHVIETSPSESGV